MVLYGHFTHLAGTYCNHILHKMQQCSESSLLNHIAGVCVQYLGTNALKKSNFLSNLL